MDNKKIYSITIAEPWDFESSDGKNIIKGRILSIINSCILVFKANYMLNFDGLSGDTFILSPRFKDCNFDSVIAEEVDVNAGLLLIDFKSELNESELKNSCKFVLIGTLDS